MEFLSATLARVKPSPTVAVTGLAAELKRVGKLSDARYDWRLNDAE